LAFGTGIFLFSEVTFFTGLLSAFVVLRSQFVTWPPMGQPRLPVEVTALNTVVLLASGVLAFTWFAVKDHPDKLARRIQYTFLLGALFLVIQGAEWVRLIQHGISTSRDVYGGLFYTIVGAHALHVSAAMVVLAVVARSASLGRYGASNLDGLRAARMYWLFVVGVWPVLYAVVYLW